MRTAILGGTGLLGKEVLKKIREAGLEAIAPVSTEVDITKYNLLKRWLRDVAPQIVINCAAYTDVDGCERDPQRAFDVNGIGVYNLAMALGERTPPPYLIHISTDYVFDGERGGYSEEDVCRPVQVYGWSKFCGEVFLSRFYPKFAILRVSWLYGWGKPNFLTVIYEKLKRGEEVSVVSENRGNPTYAVNVAEGVLKLIEKPSFGVFHLVDRNEGGITRYEEALGLAEILGVPGLVKKREGIQRVAKRPRNSSLLVHKWAKLYGNPPWWKDSLRRFVMEREYEEDARKA